MPRRADRLRPLDNSGGHLITSEFEPSEVARARHNLTAGGLTDLVEIGRPSKIVGQRH